MTEYTQESLDVLYDHLILSDTICIKRDGLENTNMGIYSNHSLTHALETLLLNKKPKELCDIIREELGRRINKK